MKDVSKRIVKNQNFQSLVYRYRNYASTLQAFSQDQTRTFSDHLVCIFSLNEKFVAINRCKNLTFSIDILCLEDLSTVKSIPTKLKALCSFSKTTRSYLFGCS